MLKALLIALSLITALSTLAEARQTPAEASGYTTTPRYAETMDWLREVADEHPWVRVTDFGTSAQGRKLPLVVIASGGEFTPEAAQASGKDILLIQAAIHPGCC